MFNYSQANKTTADNFDYYNLTHRLVALFGADADRWTTDDPELEAYGQVRDAVLALLWDICGVVWCGARCCD
jgi:hypothetical protein